MFPGDEPRARVSTARACPDCDTRLEIHYDGPFGTVYVCPQCQTTRHVPAHPWLGERLHALRRFLSEAPTRRRVTAERIAHAQRRLVELRAERTREH